MKRIKAIKTKYRNVEFRSRLEARWAVWFDEMEIPWSYEPEGFTVNGEAYLPDFYTTAINKGVYIEIKPKGISGREKAKTLRMLDAFDGRLLLISGSPMLGEYTCTMGGGWERESFVFADCRKCGGLSFVGNGGTYFGNFGKHKCKENERPPLEDGPRIMKAYAKAMNHKFGERLTHEIQAGKA
jgi:hypothetical protein